MRDSAFLDGDDQQPAILTERALAKGCHAAHDIPAPSLAPSDWVPVSVPFIHEEAEIKSGSTCFLRQAAPEKAPLSAQEKLDRRRNFIFKACTSLTAAAMCAFSSTAYACVEMPSPDSITETNVAGPGTINRLLRGFDTLDGYPSGGGSKAMDVFTLTINGHVAFVATFPMGGMGTCGTCSQSIVVYTNTDNITYSTPTQPGGFGSGGSTTLTIPLQGNSNTITYSYDSPKTWEGTTGWQGPEGITNEGWCVELPTPTPTPAPSFSPAPTPSPGPINPQLDTGIQGALPRYNTSPSFTDGHKYMPPKNTAAMSMVEMFPWLYQDIYPQAQFYLYRGTGGNTAADVLDPINLNAGRDVLAPSNTENLNTTDNAAAINTAALNMTKCQILSDKTQDKCYGIDILGLTVGTILGESSYISDSSALLNRLQYDSCTNQVIIPQGLNPNFVFNDIRRRNDDPINESWCQPMRTVPVDCFRNKLVPITKCLPDAGERDGNLYDYRAWGYLRFAWQSVLEDGYTPSGGTGLYWGGEIAIGDPPYLTNTTLFLNAGIPALTGLTFPGTLKLLNPIKGEDQYGSPFLPILPGGSVGPIGSVAAGVIGLFGYNGALTTINDLAAQPYERIWDPTHPYSPRWDFKGTDRLFTALATISNPPIVGIGFSTSTSTCVVRCASVPVDILSFRLLAFTSCMGCRIGINSAIWWVEAKYLNTDVDVNFWFVGADCEAVSLDKAVDDTTNDNIWGPVFSPPNAPLGFEIPIPFVTHGRLHGDPVHNAGEDMKWTIAFFIIPCPAPLCSGCHFLMCPECFAKSLLHDFVNPDTIPGINVLDNLGKPQKQQFDSLWPICSTKYDYQDATLNIPECAACTLISGDSNPLNGVRECCDDLAHALAPINTLKIRNTVFNPGLRPTPEGYTLREYFSWRDDTRTSPYTPRNDSSVLQTDAINNDPGTATTIGLDLGGNAVDYEGTHMPYMRWWDTGASSTGVGDKGSTTNPSNVTVGMKDYNPDSDCGAYDTIVGVGTEDWDGNNTPYWDSGSPHLANKDSWSVPPTYSTVHDSTHYDEDTGAQDNAAKYCRYGGNGFALDADTGMPLSLDAVNNVMEAAGFNPSDFFGIDLSDIGIPPFYKCIRLRTINVADRDLGPDAMTSWDELKYYQMRSIERGLNCLPQYEKMHKPFGNEEFVLDAAGGSYNVPILMNRSAGTDTDALDPAKGPAQGYYKVPYRGAPPASGGNMGTNSAAPGNIVPGAAGYASIEFKTLPWPLNWRGYVTEDVLDTYATGANNCYNTFPQFFGDSTSIGLGVALVLPCAADSNSISGAWHVPGAMSPLGNVPALGTFSYPELWPIMPGGLGQAQVGDIVYITQEDINYELAIAYINWAGSFVGLDPVGYFAAPMPFTAIVTAIHHQWLGTDGAMHDAVANVGDCPATEPQCFTTCEEYVIMEENDMGKFPDVCGNTDMYGHGQSRTVYKEWLPAASGVAQKFDLLFPPNTVVADSCGHTYTTQNVGFNSFTYTDDWGNTVVLDGIANSNYGSCADPKMSECTYADYGLGTASSDSVNLWNHFRIYRPTIDIRQ